MKEESTNDLSAKSTVIPHDGLDIEIRSAKPGALDAFKEISLTVVSGKIKQSLNDLLPDFWSFGESRDERLHTDPERKLVLLPKGILKSGQENFFRQPVSVFRVLHEIAHAKLDENKSEEDIEIQYRLRDKFAYEGPESFSDEEKKQYEKLVLFDEKRAWQIALELYNKLGEKGLNAEPRLSRNDLLLLAERKLNTYKI